MSGTLLVSVIVPVFNRAGYLGAALDSIDMQELNGVELEVIVVNDGSTDGSGTVAERWAAAHPEVSCRCLEQANAGPGAARNAGVAAARGEMLAFLDADDLWPSDGLRKNVEEWHGSAQARPKVVLGLTQAFISVAEAGAPVSETEPFRFLNVGAGLFEREVFERAGGFDPTLRGSEDVDWFLRARDAGLGLRSHGEVTLWYRRHGENMTRGQSLADLDFHLALKRSLDRRRRNGKQDVTAPFGAQG